MPHRPIFVAAATLFALALVTYRLTLGVDFVDESYYAAMAVRFLQGDRPFVDELFINQTGIFPILPLVKPYLYLFGKDGLILYLRALYFIFSLLLMAGVYLTLRNFASSRVSALAALLGVVFIPLNIPALSYNTIGGGGFALALFLSLAYLNQRKMWQLIAAMSALVLSELAYPPLFLPGLLFLGLVYRHSPLQRQLFLKAYTVAHLSMLALCFPLLWTAGLKIIDSYIYTAYAHHHGGGWEKGKTILTFLVESVATPAGALAYSSFIAAWVTGRRFWLALFPLCLAYNFWIWGFPSVWIFIHLAVSGPLLFLLGSRPREDRELLKLVWLPSFVAGVVTAWMSSSSPANFIIGFWAAGIVSTYYMAQLTKRSGAAVIMVAVFLVYLFAGRVFYTDGDFTQLTRRVPSGPFRGLATTPEKLEYLRGITDDIRALEGSEGKVVFYEFPAGYLLTNRRIAVNSAWMRTESLGKLFYVRHYAPQMNQNDLVFKINTIQHGYPSGIQYSDKDPFVELLNTKFDRILVRPNYEVFKPKNVASISDAHS